MNIWGWVEKDIYIYINHSRLNVGLTKMRVSVQPASMHTFVSNKFNIACQNYWLPYDVNHYQ